MNVQNNGRKNYASKMGSVIVPSVSDGAVFRECGKRVWRCKGIPGGCLLHTGSGRVRCKGIPVMPPYGLCGKGMAL